MRARLAPRRSPPERRLQRERVGDQVQELRRRRVGRCLLRRDDGGAQPVDRRGRSPRCRSRPPRTSNVPSRQRRRRCRTWLDKTPKDRMELLLKLADVIDDNADELTQLESQNVGKPMSIAGDEMPFSADNLRFFAGAARTLEGKAAGEYVEGYTSIIRREPLGIVAGITPWNYPLMMAIWKMGPALAAGNVQILKPAEQTPLTTLRFAELAQEFLPPGVLQVITGRRRARGRRARAPRRDPADLADRLGRDGQADRDGSRAEQPQARPPRARRQGADGRARRRRSGHGRRGDQDRRLLELRPGLHRVLADPRPQEDLRRRACPRRSRRSRR